MNTATSIITLNVGGMHFCTSRQTLERFSFFKNLHDGSFVDRDPTYFHIVLNHMRGSHFLPRKTDVLLALRIEADFYSLHTLLNDIDRCLRTRKSARTVRGEMRDLVAHIAKCVASFTEMYLRVSKLTLQNFLVR
jgi:hypothetical protein